MLIMSNKDLQEERVRSYFIQAANEILRGEGISNLSVRNVAEKAGYSYATLYNYFKNINELLSVCIVDFIEEGKEFIVGETKNIPKGKARLEAIIKSYVKFFIQYPGIFELFYITPLKNAKSAELIISFLEEMCGEDWDYLIQYREYNKVEIETKKESIKYLITGTLVLYNNRRYPADYVNFQESMNIQIDNILNNRK
jgi:AcrR family transcriptional regulator